MPTINLVNNIYPNEMANNVRNNAFESKNQVLGKENSFSKEIKSHNIDNIKNAQNIQKKHNSGINIADHQKNMKKVDNINSKDVENRLLKQALSMTVSEILRGSYLDPSKRIDNDDEHDGFSSGLDDYGTEINREEIVGPIVKNIVDDLYYKLMREKG